MAPSTAIARQVFTVRPGRLPGGTVSLEAAASAPGRFLRHRCGKLESGEPGTMKSLEVYHMSHEQNSLVKQDTSFAECTHARAWLAHGACKFYR